MFICAKKTKFNVLMFNIQIFSVEFKISYTFTLVFLKNHNYNESEKKEIEKKEI